MSLLDNPVFLAPEKSVNEENRVKITSKIPDEIPIEHGIYNELKHIKKLLNAIIDILLEENLK